MAIQFSFTLLCLKIRKPFNSFTARSVYRGFKNADVLDTVFQDQDSEFEQEFSDEELSNPEDVPDSGGESALEDENDTDTAHAPISSSGRGRARNPQLPRPIFRLNWEVYDDFDPFESDWLPKYQRPRGILVDTHEFKPVDYFSLFFPDEALTLMAEETNRYAMQYLDSHAIFLRIPGSTNGMTLQLRR